MSTANQNPGIDETRVLELIRQQVGKSTQASEPAKPVRLEGKGLQLQADVLQDIDRCLARIQAAICVDSGEVDGDIIAQSAEEGRKVIKGRIKNLKIADVAGWSAVQKYEGAADLGDDAEDSKKIQKAIDSARAESRRSWSFRSARAEPYPSTSAKGPQMAARYIPPAGRPMSAGVFAGKAEQPAKWNQECYGCHRFGHWKQDCPFQQSNRKSDPRN